MSPFNYLAAAVWFYLPAFIANAVPVFVGKSTWLAPYRIPVWEKGLGKNKSWAGVVAAVIAGVLTGWLQIALTPWEQFTGSWPWIGWSALIALGAMVGDCVKSYFKRRLGIAPGGAWPVIDGIDYVVGALILGLPMFVPSWQIAVALLIAGPILSLLANVFSYTMGWKNVWY